MTNSTAGLLPLQVRAYPGDPMMIEREHHTWMFKPFKFFAANGNYVGEIIFSTSDGHGINDLAEAKTMAQRMAVATNCCDMLLTACMAVEADIAHTGSISATTAELAAKAVAMAREVESLVQL